MWERACSRIRCVIQHIQRLIHRFREQARSHIFGWCCRKNQLSSSQIGAWSDGFSRPRSS
ncbi:hypothetical protein FIV38_26310 [Pseudomonas proteolytica]|nr:hypothetical protein F4W61_25765 [Pseudomonas proteolytica]TWR74996.1 hypothetical protein FIV38_26310 [Pseudomonas proteolytica]